MFAALCHDFGKPSTTKMEGGRWRSKGHCEEGVGPAQDFLHAIGCPFDLCRHVLRLIKEHLVHAGIDKPSDRAIRRLAHRIAPATIAALGRLVEADHSGRPPLPKGNPLKVWVERAEALSVSVGKPQPILMGRHLIELGMSAGPFMGLMLGEAFQAQLDGVFANVDDGKRWVRSRAGS